MADGKGRRHVQDRETGGPDAALRLQRRKFLAPLACALSSAVMLGGCDGDPPAPDENLRLQDEAVLSRYDALKRQYQDGRLAPPEYRAQLTQLRADELAVLDRARHHQFSDITIGHYFHRSRLKFPSPIAAELEQLSRSSVPGGPLRPK